ncbi:MAG TPA: hypothetical protein VGY57_02125 [Vicinamibacterales bacterium]|nr:hypothetical protein [Vicinamibacterales bacterium]
MWLTGIVSGLAVVWAYENRPGAGANPPQRWPARTTLVAAADRPTLIFLAHPQCTCTRASLDELTEVIARTPTRPKAYVLFLRPTTFDAGWAKTDLWRRAAALPDTTVLRDDDGVEARRFGVETSGQTLLYDHAGALIFSGGITGSRGHVGANAGEASLVALLSRGRPEHRETSVFGCPLFSSTH